MRDERTAVTVRCYIGGGPTLEVRHSHLDPSSAITTDSHCPNKKTRREVTLEEAALIDALRTAPERVRRLAFEIPYASQEKISLLYLALTRKAEKGVVGRVRGFIQG